MLLLLPAGRRLPRGGSSSGVRTRSNDLGGAKDLNAGAGRADAAGPEGSREQLRPTGTKKSIQKRLPEEQ